MMRAWLAFGGYFLASAIAYGWVIRHPWSEPWVVPVTAWDGAIALWPPAAYPYATYALLLPLLLLSRRNHPGLARVLGAGIAAQTLQLILDYLLPTRIPFVHPAPAGTLLALVQSLDTPLAAFPSGHVGLPMAIAMAAAMEARRRRRARGGGAPDAVRAWKRTAAWYLAWTAMMIAAALLTKQHVLLDAAGGLAFGSVVGLVYGPLASLALTPRRIVSSTGREHNKAESPPAKPPEERYWSTATRAAPVQKAKPGGGVPLHGLPEGHSMPRAGRDRINAQWSNRWRAWGIDIRSLGALGIECGAAALALAGAVAFDSLAAKALCIVILATRQHALLVLYHDAVHGLIARNRRVNDFLINACVGAPSGLPVHLYRALHLQHHKALGTDRDPERVLLYHGQPWRFRPLTSGKLLLQFLGDLLLWNNLRMVWRYFRLRARPGALELPITRAYPETAIQVILFWAAAVACGLRWPEAAWPAIAIWLLTYATATQWLQKIRSFAEHTTADRDASLSGSWEPGLLGRLVLWPYRIQYHREHHALPHLPWHRLPRAPAIGRRLPGRALIHHLWRSA
jgi:fatty acid desaturase